jgi:hypothetical protein
VSATEKLQAIRAKCEAFLETASKQQHLTTL